MQPWQFNSLPRIRGFTLIELIVTLVIVAIVAVTALPRFFNRQTFDARGYYDQAIAMLRYGQKVAIAQRRDVYVNASASNNTLCLTYSADVTCALATGVINPTDQTKFSKATPVGVALLASLSFSFSPLGKPSPDGANKSIGIVGDSMTRTITIERETGYVH